MAELSNIAHSVKAGLPMPRREQLAAEWRSRAEQLARYARALRREGDGRGAEDAEEAAADYWRAADELESGWPA